MSEGSKTRRAVLGVAGLGIGLLAAAPAAEAAPMGELEKANLKLVNDFCAAWPTTDPAKIMTFFSDNPTYRQTETQQAAVGREAVSAKVDAMYKAVLAFKVHDSWARGPMVINERTDTFTGGRLKSWHGVGVFLVQNGKIVEWYDYTIERVTA